MTAAMSVLWALVGLSGGLLLGEEVRNLWHR